MRTLVIMICGFLFLPFDGVFAQNETPVENGIFTVQIYFPQQDGSPKPAVGVPVAVYEFAAPAPMMRPGAEGPKQISVKKVLSDSSGLVRVPLKGVGGRTTVEAIATYQNASFRTGKLPSNQGSTSIALYPVIEASKGLLGGMVCRTEVSEAYLFIDCALKLVTRSANAVRLNGEGPRMPFVGLAVGPSGALNNLLTDMRYNHFNVRVHSGNVVLKRSARGIFLDGVILPEKPASLQIRYPIPHLTQQTELALRAEFPLWTFGFELNGPERYAPELRISERVHRNVEVERGRVIHSFQMSEGLPAGKLLTMSLGNMPLYNPIWRKVVVTGAFIMLGLFLALWFRFWRQEVKEETSA